MKDTHVLEESSKDMNFYKKFKKIQGKREKTPPENPQKEREGREHVRKKVFN